MKSLFYFFLLIITPICYAQNANTEVEDTTEEVDKSMTSQFDYLYRTSTKYQEYKVISINKYQKLKQNVLDSLSSQKSIITDKVKTIKTNNLEITKLKEELANTQQDLATAIDLKDSRSVFGLPVQKSIFTIIIAITYSVLLILLGFFIFKYKQNLSITTKAVSALKGVEAEFETHKKTSLKRFQEVSRKLQDELNKNWKKEK
ncbi:cell shape-determining protein MreC [Wenyingzhuangia heitensis]|uniref:Cell shape-determining protein MreC n=1 Tax=Wenyingzhuangia heitensis TaxID=1487859 RepID=A0ABX0U5F5_9FLAO|nr:hypothetical protein [Wenyingzhuangia heitensis]NIJ44089.1 cell shape-determining protein MreC [Wenyingzhuangia heitensis]